ncbi:MAG: hypothetical protein WC378_10435 [Opitutaceae bacterium]|jgi:hypothetical protein
MKMVSKFIVIALLAGFSCAVARAEYWGNFLGGPGFNYYPSVSVPVAATCDQFGEPMIEGAIVTNSGPLGYFNHQYYQGAFDTSGPISAGTYSVLQIVQVSGYTGTFIYW